MGRWLWVWALLFGAACGDDDGGRPADMGGLDAAAPDLGPSCTELTWDPATGLFARWPEPLLLREDPATGTGFRLAVDEERWGPTFTAIRGYEPVFTEDLPTLDGFGANAQAFFQFGRAFDETRLPSGATGEVGSGVGLVVLGESPRLEPVLLETGDLGSTLFLAPMHPLPEGTWVAAFVTRDLTDAAGGCLEPSPAMEGLLADADAGASPDADALAALRTLGVIDTAAEVVALSTFPVQTLTDDSRTIAADIAARGADPIGVTECVAEERWRRCEGTFDAIDYRGPDEILLRDPGDPLETDTVYTLPFTVWLPNEPAPGPLPTVVWGSGLGSGRGQGAALAEFAVPEGYAVIAIDPVSHGEHPAVPEGEPGEDLAAVLRFFTLTYDPPDRQLAPLILREHWRQSSYDKLQLVERIQAGIDLDADGVADLDGERLSYLGVSLGGIMGVEPLALTDAFDAAVLVVPGGRVAAIISDSETFGPLVDLVRPPGVSEGQVKRFFPILQTLLDRGDAATYAPHVLGDRFDAATPPSVLAGVVLDDAIVPNVANYTLMRALGSPLVAEPLQEVPGIGDALPAPVRGNLADGAVTAGFLQFDVVEDDGEVVPATHDNIGRSGVGVAAWLAFLRAHYDDGLAVIVDPYALTGLAHGG